MSGVLAFARQAVVWAAGSAAGWVSVGGQPKCLVMEHWHDGIDGRMWEEEEEEEEIKCIDCQAGLTLGGGLMLLPLPCARAGHTRFA